MSGHIVYEPTPQRHSCAPPERPGLLLGTIWRCNECGQNWVRKIAFTEYVWVKASRFRMWRVRRAQERAYNEKWQKINRGLEAQLSESRKIIAKREAA